MNKRSLIVGLGFGELYKRVYTKLGHEIVTIDSDLSKNPTYTSPIDLPVDEFFDTAHICVPNHLHEAIAQLIAPRCKIVFIEKPGVRDRETWEKLVATFTSTKFVMVKNNQYRTNMPEMKKMYASAKTVKLHWINDNRVPNPGTWFTTKQCAFGGVSRDLLPHLLSMYMSMESNWVTTKWDEHIIKQNWKLDDLTDTAYGTVKADGVYDVDDYVKFTTTTNGKNWEIIADWRSNNGNDIGIYFDDVFVPLGLCPEDAYEAMIISAIDNTNNDNFWQAQYLQDCWLHSTIAV